MSSLNELKDALSFSEWKKTNPVDHRNRPIDPEDDFALRNSFRNYIEGFISKIESPLQKKGATEVADRFLVEGFSSLEELNEALDRVSEVPYAEQESEVLENYFRLRRDYSSTNEDGSSVGDIFYGLEESGFNPVRFARLREKQVGADILEPNMEGERESLTDEELSYLQGFEDPLKLLVEGTEEDRLRTKLSDGRLGVAIINGQIVSKDIPQENIDAEVTKSIQAGAIDPRLKGQVIDSLKNPAKGSTATRNTDEAERLIRSVPTDSYLYDSLRALIKQVGASHVKPQGGEVHEFIEVDGVPTGVTKAGVGKYNRVVTQDYREALKDFRTLYPLRGHLSDKEILHALRSVAMNVAVQTGAVTYHEKKSFIFTGKKTRAKQSLERVEQNVYQDPVTKQSYIHPSLLLASEDFNNLSKRKDLYFPDVDEDGDKVFINLQGETKDSEGRTLEERLRALRKKKLDDSYETIVDSIFDGTADLRNSWLNHIKTTDLYDPKFKSSKSRGEILGEWLDTESGKNFYNRVGRSILQASGDLVGALSLIAGKAQNLVTSGDDPVFLEKLGGDILKQGAAEREANKALSSIFGQQASYVDDGVMFIAPLAVDLTATTGLTVTTGGAGGAMYLSAAGTKYGVRSTAKAYAAGLVGGGMRTLLKEAGEESVEATVKKAIEKKLIKVKPLPLVREGVAKTAEATSAVKLFEAAAKGMRSKRVMFPAMAAPAFLRSAGHTYGDMHMLLKGATDADGKPLSAEEIEDRATGAAFLGGFFTVATVLGLHSLGSVGPLKRLGLGGLETWAARGGTTRGLKAILEKLRQKPYASLGEATKDITSKVLEKGLAKMSHTFLKRTGSGVLAESLQEGSDALLNTYARSWGARGTSADDWDRPFLDRAKEGLIGAAYGAGLGALGGGVRGTLESRANRGTMGEGAEARVRREIASDIREQTVAKLQATGSTETANTVEEILAAMDEASAQPEVDTASATATTAAAAAAADASTPTDTDTDTQAAADEAQQQLEDQRERAAAERVKPLQEKLAAAKSKKEREAIEKQIADQLGTSLQRSSPEIAESEAQLTQEAALAEEERILGFLQSIGLEVLSAEMLPVILNPNDFSLVERQAIISQIEEFAADKDLTQEQKDLVAYIIHQLQTGITEGDADANVENSTAEQQSEAVAAANRAQAESSSAQESSGTGGTAVTPDAKSELINALVVGRGMTKEDATAEVEELMSQVRRDPQEAEDLARIERDEPVLKQTISSIKNGLDALKERAEAGPPRAYRGGVGQDYFTDTPTQGLIDALDKRIAYKARRRDLSDKGTRAAELELLGRLKDTLEDLLALNTRRKELEPDPVVDGDVDEDVDGDTEKYPKGTIVRSDIYKSEGDIEILKRKEDDRRGAVYLAMFSKSKRSGDISETAIDSIVSKPETEEESVDPTPLSPKERRDLEARAEAKADEAAEAGDPRPQERLEELRDRHQRLRAELQDPPEGFDRGERFENERDLVTIENYMREIAGEPQVDTSGVTPEVQAKSDAYFAKRVQEIQAKLAKGEEITSVDRRDWDIAGKDEADLPAPTPPAPESGTTGQESGTTAKAFNSPHVLHSVRDPADIPSMLTGLAPGTNVTLDSTKPNQSLNNIVLVFDPALGEFVETKGYNFNDGVLKQEAQPELVEILAERDIYEADEKISVDEAESGKLAKLATEKMEQSGELRDEIKALIDEIETSSKEAVKKNEGGTWQLVTPEGKAVIIFAPRGNVSEGRDAFKIISGTLARSGRGPLTINTRLNVPVGSDAETIAYLARYARDLPHIAAKQKKIEELERESKILDRDADRFYDRALELEGLDPRTGTERKYRSTEQKLRDDLGDLVDTVPIYLFDTDEEGNPTNVEKVTTKGEKKPDRDAGKGPVKQDKGVLLEIDPKQKAKDELDAIVEEDVEAGALRRGGAKNALRRMGTAVFGFPSSIKVNPTDQKAAADREFEGVYARYPLVQFDESGSPLTTEKEVRASLESIMGTKVPDEQWATLQKTRQQFSKTDIYTIRDTPGGIFDDGKGNGGTNEIVILFNNDPRAMKVALDQVVNVHSIPIPKDFPREKVNQTLRADTHGRESAADVGEVRSVYYPVGDGSGSEVRASGNYTHKKTSSADELATTEAQKTNTLLQFINTSARIDVSLNKEDPTRGSGRVEESLTIAQTIQRILSYVEGLLSGSINDKGVYIYDQPLPLSTRSIKNLKLLSNSEEDARYTFTLDLNAKGARFAVEVAILQAVTNKSEGQTNEEAIMALFNRGEKDFSDLTKLTGKTEADFETANELFGFVLSKFLGRGIPTGEGQSIFDAVAEHISNLTRHEGAASEGSRANSEKPTPNYNAAKGDIDNRLDKASTKQISDKARAESGSVVQPAELASPSDTGSPDEAPKEDAPDTSTLAGVGEVEVDPLIKEIQAKAGDYFLATDARVIRSYIEALEGAGIINLGIENDTPVLEVIDRFEQAMRALPKGWSDTVPDSVNESMQSTVTALGSAMMGGSTRLGASKGAGAAILYLYSINAMGGGLAGGTAATAIVQGAGIELDATDVVKVVNGYRSRSEADYAPSFLDKKFQERIKEMNIQEIADLGLENRDVESLINVLKNAGPDHRMAADLLLQFEDYIRTNLTPVIIEAGNHFAGSFSPTGEVTVNVSGRYGDGVISVILHEVGHAVFQRIISAPDAELTSGQRAAKKQMQVVYDRARKQWENSKKRGIANRNLDYVFETGRQTARLVGPSGVIAASGDLPFYAGADETTLDASQAAMEGTAGSDVILPAARGFEEFFTSWLSSSDFQEATRKIAVGDRSLFRRIIDAIKTMFGVRTGVEKQQAEVVDTIYNFAKLRGSRDLTQSYEDTRARIIAGVQQQVDLVGLKRGLSADLDKRLSQGLVDGPEIDLFKSYLDDFVKAREEGRSGDEEASLAEQVLFSQLLRDEVSRQVPTGVRVVFTNAEDLRSRGLGFKAFAPAFKEVITIEEGGVQKTITQVNFNTDALQSQADLLGDIQYLSSVGSVDPAHLASEEGGAQALEMFRLASRRVRNELELMTLEETVHVVDELVVTDAEREAILEEVGIDALVEAYKDYLQVSDRFNYLRPETREKAEADAEPKLQALREGSPKEMAIALSEMVRMDVQRVVKGATTESVFADALDGLSSPYVTALSRQLTKIVARLGPSLRGERNSNYQQVVQRIVGALKALDSNKPEDAGFIPEQRGLDANQITPLGDIEPLLNSFERQSDLFKKVTDPKSTPAEKLEAIKAVRERQVAQSELQPELVLELNNGKWSGASSLKGIKKITQQLKIGDQDPRVQEIIKKLQLWATAMEGQKTSDFTVLIKLLKRAYKNDIPNDILVALNTAAGTTDNLDVEPEFKETLKATYRAVKKRIEKEVKAGKRPDTDAEPEALASIKRVLVRIPLEDARVERVKAYKEKQKIAYQTINDDTKLGPEIVLKMKSIRASLDAMSKIVSKNYGLGEVRGGRLNMVIDRQSGVYLTRRYKGYDDFAYLEEIQKPNGKFAARRDVAVSYFEELRVDVEIKEELARMQGLRAKLGQEVEFKTPEEEAEAKRVTALSKTEMAEEAKIRAELRVKDSRNETIAEMNTLLKAIEERARGDVEAQNVASILSKKHPQLRRLLKLDTDALKKKTDLDPRVRYLLGQYGLEFNEDGTFEEKGLIAFEQTFNALTRMVEQSSFFSQLKRIGGVVDGDFEKAFVFTLQEAIDAGLDGNEYTNVRTGRLLSDYIDSKDRVTTDEDESQTVKRGREVFDFTYDMFIPTEGFKALRDYQKVSRTTKGTSMFEGRTVLRLIKDREPVKAATRMLFRSTEIVNGIFLMAKTAYNIPAYPLRNMITAVTTYGSANGVGPHHVAKELAILFLSRLRQPFRAGSVISPERRPGSETELSATEYRMLGIDQRTLELTLINQQLAGGRSGDISELFFESLGDVFEASKKSRLGKVKDVAKAPFKISYDIVASIAQAIDTATKVAIYKKEMRVLNKAQKYEKDNGVDLGYLNMSEEAQQQLAAQKTVSVAPTYSEHTLLQRVIRRINPFFFDAFSGFFVDQFRIFYNQILTGTSHRETKDRNPIIESNGRKRRLGSMLTHGSFAGVVTGSTFLALKVILDREEEELLEANRPSYARNNSYFHVKGETLIDLGLTSVPQIIDMFSGLPSEIDPNKLYSVDITYINGMSPVLDGSQQALIKALAGMKEGEAGTGFKEAAATMYMTYLERFLGQTFSTNRTTGKLEFDPVDAIPFGQVPDTLAKLFIKGEDPDGRPLLKEGMDNTERLSAVFDRVVLDTVLPSNLEKLKRYYKERDADDPDVQKRAEQTLSSVMAPLKVRVVDPSQGMRTVAYEINREREGVRTLIKDKLKDGSVSYTDKEIEDLARRAVKNTVETDRKLISMIETSRNFEEPALRLTDEQIYNALTKAGVGKNRAKAVMRSKTERYLPSKAWYIDLLKADPDGEWPDKRARIYDAAVRRISQEKQYEDVYTGQGSDTP